MALLSCRRGALALLMAQTACGQHDWFEMPPRTKGSISKVSWGESPVQPKITQEMIADNPWWQAVKVWKSKGHRAKLVRQKIVFAGGLPRSGTTLLEYFLRSHGRMSSLTFPAWDNQHEGMPLVGGGLGRYGGSRARYSIMCSLDEESGKVDSHAVMNEDTGDIKRFRRKTWEGWQSWDFTKSMLVVKDPPNLLRMRLLQAAFNETHDVFAIFTLMHPLEIGSRYTCNPGTKERLIIAKNWMGCHNTWIDDLPFIKNYLVIPFEAWFKHPASTGRAIESFLHLIGHVPVTLPGNLRRLRGSKSVGNATGPPCSLAEGLRSNASSAKKRRLVMHGSKFLLSRKYFARCRKSWSAKFYELPGPMQKLTEAYKKFGYDLSDSRKISKPTAFELCVMDGKPCRLAGK